MMQQINLYQPILRKQKKVFAASTLLLGNLLILGGLLLLFGYTQLQTQTLQGQYDQAVAQRNERQVRLQQMRQQFPPRQADASLPTRLEQARLKLRQQQAMHQAVQGYDDEPQRRFSSQLRGLAQQVKGGIWLTEIRLQNGQMRLRGETGEAQQVPLLVQALSQEASFAGMTFDELLIARDDSSGRIVFTLDSQRESTTSDPRGARQ
jgi:Tfp pilus assembly protein PilN